MAKISVPRQAGHVSVHGNQASSVKGGPYRGPAKRPRGRSKSGGGLVVGFLGWLVALGIFGAVVLAVKKQQDRIRQVKRDLDTGIAAIQTSVIPRQEEISKQKKQLQQDINESIKTQSVILSETERIKLAIKEIQPEAESLERTHGKLTQSVVAVKDDANITGEGLQDLRTRLTRMEGQRADLKEEYRRRFEAMRTLYEEKKDRPEPEMLRQFYGTHRHTVFAPAAGFFAGEKLYAKKRSQDALRMYRDVLRRYPDSGYSENCNARITEIEGGAPFKEPDTPIDFYPYHPFAAETPAQ